jgi:hypothetical protein
MWTTSKVHHYKHTWIASCCPHTVEADYCGQIKIVTFYCGQIQLWQTTVNKYICCRLLWTNVVVAGYCGQIQMWQTVDNIVADNCVQITYTCGRQLWKNTVVADNCGQIVIADNCGQIQLWQNSVDK